MFDQEKWRSSPCVLYDLTKAPSEEEGKEDDDVINCIKDKKVFVLCYTFLKL